MNTRTIETIYLAGKMQDADWRRNFFDDDQSHDHSNQLGWNPLTIESDSDWPESTDPSGYDDTRCDRGAGLICGLRYTGPFFVDNLGGHGYNYWPSADHGANVSPSEHDRQHGAALEQRRNEVQQWCLQAIKRADLIFAWIDCIDCYGTIAEIGYAKALGKIIWIAGPREYNDLWFVYSMADYNVAFANQGRHGTTPHEIFQSLLHDYQRYHPHFDSPIEQAFWDEWCHCHDATFFLEHPSLFSSLIPQHPIGKYRVDFAHLATKTAIELDGHATHSSPDAIAYDRQRQRYIEAQGWHVIRFGGKEVYTDVTQCVREVILILKERER